MIHETMIEQIRRLNAEEARKHQKRKQEVLNKIHKMREKQKNEQRVTIPQ